MLLKQIKVISIFFTFFIAPKASQLVFFFKKLPVRIVAHFNLMNKSDFMMTKQMASIFFISIPIIFL
jgi:hypothetical protein